MHTARCFGGLLLITILAASCSDTDATGPMKPSSTTPGPRSAPFVGMASSSVVSHHIVPNSVCPAIPPFIAPFDVNVHAPADADLVLEQMQAGFVDFFGITAPPITLTQPNVLIPFGQPTRIPAGTSRTFPIRFPFGCETASAGTLTLVMHAHDQFGLGRSAQVVVSVR